MRRTIFCVSLPPAPARAFCNTVGRFDVVVVNPEPLTAPKWGNGTSNKAHLLVNYRY